MSKEEEAKRILEERDRTGGVNTGVEISDQPQSITSLGKGAGFTAPSESTISGAADNLWKILPLHLLPSLGNFYPKNSEITIRSASTEEIRHWSTIDEHDPIDINDKLNFILEKCVRFKIVGTPAPLNFKDFLQIDRFYLIFRIHELTFPNNKNQLSVYMQCDKACKDEDRWADYVPVKSAMLRIYNFNEEAMSYYSEENRCFIIDSAKLNDSFKLYVPSIGVGMRLSQLKKDNFNYPKEFVKVLPYLVEDWRILSPNKIKEYYFNYRDWPDDKFKFVTLFTELMESGKSQKITKVCPKCSADLETPIFSQFSFSVRDIFFLSSRLSDLI